MLLKIKILKIIFLALLISHSLFSQNTNSNPENDKRVIYRIASYSVEIDKLVQEEFINDESTKIIFTCIPAGILVFESKIQITPQIAEAIQNKLKKSSSTIHFFQLQGFTLSEAEKECSNFRSN